VLARSRCYLMRETSQVKEEKQDDHADFEATTFCDSLESLSDLNDKITRWKHDQGS